MAKVVLGRYTEKDINFARAIKACVQRAGAEIDKLVAAAHISRCTYYTHLRKPEQITVGELRAYIRELDIPKEDIIAALYLDQEGGQKK